MSNLRSIVGMRGPIDPDRLKLLEKLDATANGTRPHRYGVCATPVLVSNGRVEKMLRWPRREKRILALRD
jgi:hypothetical protein